MTLVNKTAFTYFEIRVFSETLLCVFAREDVSETLFWIIIILCHYSFLFHHSSAKTSFLKQSSVFSFPAPYGVRKEDVKQHG